MRSLTAAPAKEEKAMKPYPAFSQAIQEVAKDVEQLTKEGEVLCQKEMQTVQDPNRREVLTDFVDFLRNVRQYWKISVKTVEKLPVRTPGWLTLLADPKEFFRSDKEADDLDEFVPGHDKEQSAKREKSIEAFAKAFAVDCKVKQIPIPKLEDDQATVDNYIKTLARYIQAQKTPLLDKGNIISLIQEVSEKLVGDEINLTSDHIKSVLTPKVKASFRGLSKFAAEDSWGEWKGKAQKISEKITEKLIPLYRSLNEAWMPKADSEADPFSKNRKMLRNFFVGARAGSGLRFYGKDVLMPNVEMYLHRVYGKEETPEQEQKEQALEQKTKALHVRDFFKDLTETEKVKFTEGAEKIKEGLDKKINETTDEEDKKKLQDVEKKVEEVGSQIYQKFQELENPDITDEQREEIAKKAEQVFEKFKGIEVELDTIIEETAKPVERNVGKNWTPPRVERDQVASGFRSLSVYAAEPEDKTPSWLKPFGGIIQQVKQMADKVKQWVGYKDEEPKEGELTPVQEQQLKQKLTEIYQEYKQKILEGVDAQIETLKGKGSDPEKDMKTNALFDTFTKKLPEALDVQMAKYQETLPLLFGGNKSVQERFKDDSEKIIQEMFKKYVIEPAAKIAVQKSRLRLADLALNNKTVMKNVQEDILKLDDNTLDKILVDSFKATIDKNKEEVELLSNSEK